MPSCPFCQTTISEDLSLYGGHCPSCLIEIPGEEAVTDPGVPFEATDSLAEAKGSGGAILSAAVAGLVVLSAVAGWWSVQGDVEPPSDEGQAADVRPISFSAHEDAAYEEPVEEEVEEPSTAERVVTQRVTSRGQPPPVDMAPADASVVPTKKAAGLGSASDGVFGSIGAAPRSRAPASIVLEDSLKIEEMIGRVLNRGAKQLEQCYNKALKLDASVKGAWYVDFTIVKEGKPVAVSVEPLEAPHTEIEACIYRAVERWRFQRISEPVDVARRYRFGG
jgi:hypothetical protein